MQKKINIFRDCLLKFIDPNTLELFVACIIHTRREQVGGYNMSEIKFN